MKSPGCAAECDCRTKWNGCHDAFVFMPPLLGGDVLLEQISFRVGGLWGAENRFMWEVKHYNSKLAMLNPCKSLITQHVHCEEQGKFRPSQDRRILNFERSLQPEPDWLPQ
jgi:hypothetical protein